MHIAKHLHLNMARAGDIFFDEDTVFPKRGGGFSLARGQSLGKTLRPVNTAHAFSTAASYGLDEDGIANIIRLLRQPFRRLVVAQIARCHGDARVCHQLLGGIFQTHSANAVRTWPDPNQPCCNHSFSKVCIF